MAKPQQARPHNKKAKKHAEAMAKQKAQAASKDCETPQKRPQKQGAQSRKKPRCKDNFSSPSRLQSQSVALPQLLLRGWGAASAAGASKVALSDARLSTRRGRRGSLRRWSLLRGRLRRRSILRRRRRRLRRREDVLYQLSFRGQRCVSRCATSSGYAARGLLHRCRAVNYLLAAPPL